MVMVLMADATVGGSACADTGSTAGSSGCCDASCADVGATGTGTDTSIGSGSNSSSGSRSRSRSRSGDNGAVNAI